MDHICIKDLEVYANHGVLKEEQKLGQKFLVSVDMSLHFGNAAANDDLEKSINYAEVAKQINDFMKNHTYKLIETVADKLATEIMMTRPLVNSVLVTVKKPWAPVGLPVDTVSVTAERKWHMAVIALGSNMGDRDGYIKLGIETLKRDGICIDKISSIYNTKPFGYTEQDDFLNACVGVRTLLSAEELLDVCHEAEQKAGRERIIHWGPRTLDLDIICYDDLVLNTEDLVIPHPQMANRRFVLEPMSEVAPGWKHPVTKLTVSRMLELLPAEDMRKSEFDIANLEFVGELNKSSKVIYFGRPGSYSQMAMFSYFGKDVDCEGIVDWDEACDKIINGEAEYAVFPIENSNAGAVNQMFDALVNKEVYIAAQIFLPVRHALLGLPDAKIEDIEVVCSHPQSFMQCEHYVGSHKNWKCISMENNAVAANHVFELGEKNRAAIAGELAAEIYGLKILDRGINDNKNNITRFCVLANHPIVTKEAKKISICLELNHESGSLYKLLSYISVFGLNMTKIESRPIPGRNFEYRFFIDFDGDMTMPDVASAMRGIRQNANRFWFLGNY